MTLECIKLYGNIEVKKFVNEHTSIGPDTIVAIHPGAAPGDYLLWYWKKSDDHSRS